MKLSVHLVTWNGEKYIPELFESLKKQTYTDWQLVVLDNASEDNTVKCIQQELEYVGVQSELIILKENTGFAGGHNTLFSRCNSEYLLLLNQDMILEPDCLEKLVTYMDAHEEIGALSPRLMKWDFKNGDLTDTIDSLGLKVFRNRRVVELYNGWSWNQISSQFDLSEMLVFGVSGALPLYRKSALDAISFTDGTFFDSSYHMYKEDVDVAFRLQSAGFGAAAVTDAVAYHDRSAAGPASQDDHAAVQNKKQQNSMVRYNSYKNHLMNIYKNEYWQNFVLDLPTILWYELKKFVWYAVHDRSVLSGVWEILSMRKKLRGKRSLIRSKRKLNWKQFRKSLGF